MTAPSGKASAPAVTAGVLYDMLRRGEATTRSDLGRMSGLSRSAVTARVATLTEANLLLESAGLASTGGRPAGSLQLNPDAGIVLAVAIGRSRSQIGTFNLLGDPELSDSMDHEVGLDHARLMPVVIERLHALLANDRREVMAVGVSLPGTVDEAKGTSLDSAALRSWSGVDVREYFADLTKAPVFVGNDAAVLAQSELLDRASRPHHALVLKASTGLSLGIIDDGRVLRGSRGAAGDIGHTKHPDAAGKLCRCGSYGCLEAVAAGWALVEQAGGADQGIGHIRDLVSLAIAGDRAARSMIRESGRLVGESLAVAIDLLNPAAIVVGGDIAPAFEIYLAGMRESVYAGISAFAATDLTFAPARFGESAGLVGCAALALDNVLRPSAIDRLVDLIGSPRA